MADKQQKLEQKRRNVIVYAAFSVIAISVFLFLFWSLRSLILPSIIGGVLAYLFRPVINIVRVSWLPHGPKVLILFCFIVAGLVMGTRQIKSSLPNEKDQLELIVRIKYKLNEKYISVMGLKENPDKGNFIYELLKDDIAPFKTQAFEMLSLNEDQKKILLKYKEGYKGQTFNPKYYNYFEENQKLLPTAGVILEETLQKNNKKETEALKNADGSSKAQNSHFIVKILNTLSTWFIMPFVFIFLLFDTGEINKFFIRLVPNKYFELSLTVLNEVDTAIGKYLRGTLLECFLVGLTLSVGLIVIGLEINVAIVIGSIAGITNAIPFLGPAIGLIVGLCYALITESISPYLPFITTDNLMLAVFAVVAVAQLLDNSIFQPIVLGSAVNLHPLVVILGVMGGSIIFGFSGMLLAIPSIVIIKVIIETVFHELKAYKLI
ncbi:MAG: AI-2E family transporter [Bdellovibrionaceae bacterium]|nr:AI-2E family transporter [Pseudobdellovibrionaceae bacterium]